MRHSCITFAVNSTAVFGPALFSIVPSQVAVAAVALVEGKGSADLVATNAIAVLVVLTNVRSTVLEAQSAACVVRSLPVRESKVKLSFVRAFVGISENVFVIFRIAVNVSDVVFSFIVCIPRHHVPFRVLEDRVDRSHLVPGTLVFIGTKHPANLRCLRWVPVYLPFPAVRLITC